jgi:hypothetical protein
MAGQNWDEGRTRVAISGIQIEELVDESDLTKDIIPAHPPNLPLPHYVHRLIALNRLLDRLKLPKSLCLAFTPAVIARWSCSRIAPLTRQALLGDDSR